MRDIVETIQRDQDRVIRDMEAPLLMVQGSAGSGKTSVALHRVAYLMYQGLQKARLDPSHILILAPNATFERYIAQVLPGLGEQQVRTMLPEELLAGVLPKARIQPRSAWVEGWLTAQGEEKRLLSLCRSFKGSQGFITLLERFLYELPRRWIPFADVDYDGKRVAWAELSRTELCQDRGRKAPLGARLRMLEKAIWERVHALRPARMERLLEFGRRFPHHAQEIQAFARMLSIRESGRLLKGLRAFTRVDCVALYRGLFADKDAFARLSEGLLPQEDMEALRLATLKGLAGLPGSSGPEIPYEDAAAMAYLQIRVHGCRTFAHLRQVVADEAQDFDILHGRLMGLLFPNARFTLLGDVHQPLGGGADEGLYEKLATALGKPPGLLVRLDKSFRCTREIWEFSGRFLPPGAAGECFSRSGDRPRIHGAADKAALEELALRLIRESREKGCQSIALVCKTDGDASRLYQSLKGREAVALIGPGDAIRSPGVNILSLYRAKGLEFDAVLLYGADARRYHDPADRSLLYVGCTRALHILELLYAGEPSPLLPREEESL
jgi:DNA helicase-2/ATP-dependent DNA helicase PcrA